MPSDSYGLVGAAALVLALAACGCATQMGVAGGIEAPVREKASFGWRGHLAALMVPPPGESGLVGGAELQGTGNVREGARILPGAVFGYSWAPEPRTGALGFELHADLGTESRAWRLLERGNFYGGMTVSTLIFLGSTRDRNALNENVRALKAIPLVVFSLRPRYTRLPGCGAECSRFSVMGEVAFRMALVTDYIP